jgi:phosphatidylglycerol:prolipoprotein diacylglycerol transferase
MAERDGIAARRVLAMQAGFSVLAILGAKLFSIAERGGELGTFSGELSGGWRYPGGLAGLVLGMVVLRPWLLPGVSLLRYADWIAPAFALSHAVMRISCFLNGCCTGDICYRPWGLAYAPGSVVASEHLAGGLIPPGAPSEPVLPLQLLFLLAAGAVGLFLLRLDRRRRFDGQIFLLFLALHEGSEFALEFLRSPEVPALELAAGVPAAIGTFALATVWLRRQRWAGTGQT